MTQKLSAYAEGGGSPLAPLGATLTRDEMGALTLTGQFGYRTDQHRQYDQAAG